MDEFGNNSSQFEFTDPRQERIFNGLLQIGEGPAAFFRDACILMNDGANLSTKSHIVAHLLREIESALRQVCLPFVTSDAKTELQTQKDKIRAILDVFEIPEDDPAAMAWSQLATELHKFAHRQGLKAPRPTEDIEELWEKSQQLLDVILQRLEERFLDWLTTLDTLLLRQTPSKEDAKLLANSIPNNPVALGYFFGKLQSPDWIKPLKKQGFFQFPPSAQRYQQEGLIRFPPWPESQYLARMAKEEPELVAQIFLEMPDTDNASVQSDLIDAALAMPPEIAVRLATKIIAAAEKPYLLLSQKLAKLIVYFAHEGEVAKAIELVSVLLNFTGESDSNHRQSIFFANELRTNLERWEYKIILEKIFPEIVKPLGMPAFSCVCDLLEKAFSLAFPPGGSDQKIDYSYLRYPWIGENFQGLRTHEIIGALILAVRESGIVLIQSCTDCLDDVISELENRQWTIFRRIALYLLGKFPRKAKPLVRERLVDRTIFDNDALVSEYNFLLSNGFAILDTDDQQIILQWIEKGPDIATFTENYKESYGFEPTESEIRKHKEIWQRDKLALIANSLPQEWLHRFNELVQEHGQPSAPVRQPYEKSSWVGPSSPLSLDELEKFSVSQILDFLQEWIPPETEFREPSPEGLARILEKVVTKDPQRFAIQAFEFTTTHPTYVRALLSGLREGLEQKKKFTWESVLELCSWIVNQPITISDHRFHGWDADPDWRWTRKSIARLLDVGFRPTQGEIPFRYREQVWPILFSLSEDTDPTPETEKQDFSLGFDAATLAINRVRPLAMQAVIQYALWTRRNLDKQNAGESSGTGFEHNSFHDLPEVKDVLEHHLDSSKDPSQAVRAVYGRLFPVLVFLDANWAKSNAEKIFPISDKEQSYFAAAWDAFIAFNRPHVHTYSVLKTQYKHAIHIIGSRTGQKAGIWINPDAKLAEHLIMLYSWGQINSEDDLLREFWTNAPDGLQAHAISYIGEALKNTDDSVEAGIIKRLQTLWDTLFTSWEKDIPNHKIGLSSFGWWFVSGKFDSKWALVRLLKILQLGVKIEPNHLVIQKLAELSIEFPRETIQCLNAIVRHDFEDVSWIIHGENKSIRQILEVCLQNSAARADAKKLINYLGSRGFLEFRDLLEQ